MITGAEVAAMLMQGRFTLAPESETQAEIETFLAARLPMGCGLAREHRLSPTERPDFLIDGRIAVEVKVRGAQRTAIFRQLGRYALYRAVEEIVLVTNVSVGEQPAPRWRLLDGKPFYYVPLGRAWM